MDRFVRGARVKEPPQTSLTLNEVSFVMCDIARKNGIRDLEGFMAHMRLAWTAYNRVLPGRECAPGTTEISYF